MAKIMITSTESKKMTDGQIENAVNKLRDAMFKCRPEITSDIAQQVLGVKNLGMMMFAPFREHVEEISNLVTRVVMVKTEREPTEVIRATSHKFQGNQEVVKVMPKGEGGEVKVFLFRLKLGEYVNPHCITDDEVES